MCECVCVCVQCMCVCVCVHLSPPQALGYLSFEGSVSLKSPQHVFCLLEDYGSDPNAIPQQPNHIYFGRWVRLFLSVCLRWNQRPAVELFPSRRADRRRPAGADPLPQCEEQALHREHQHGRRALLHHGQPRQGQGERRGLRPLRWHR